MILAFCIRRIRSVNTVARLNAVPYIFFIIALLSLWNQSVEKISRYEVFKYNYRNAETYNLVWIKLSGKPNRPTTP